MNSIKMVNYCFVIGCTRNSRQHSHLHFFSFPKEPERVKEWLIASGHEDLTLPVPRRPKYSRICSRHFPPSAIKKNRKLAPDALPTLNLDGNRGPEDGDMSDSDYSEKSKPHEGIVCNNCQKLIYGFRYKCVTCPDYDLCQACETAEVHNAHFMLRIPNPIKFKKADDLVDRWQRFFKSEHITPDQTSDIGSSTDSSDDEPITKYAKNYDSGTDLSEDIKEKIRKEVSRVLTLRPVEPVKKTKERKREREPTPGPSKRFKVSNEFNIKNQRIETVVDQTPEMVFADVNEGNIMEMKTEYLPEVPLLPPVEMPVQVVPTLPVVMPLMPVPVEVTEQGCEEQPVMRVKLSDDLRELMIEVTSNNQRTVYKYN